MLLGTAKANITPPLGTWLAGYVNGRGADSVLHELQLRVLWFQESLEAPPAEAVCLISAEILGFGANLTQAVRTDLAEQFGLRPEAVMLAATHTHSAPQTCENMPNCGGSPVPEYIAELRRLIVESVASARENVAPITLRVGRGRLSGFAISRRLIVDGISQFAPNPEGPRDDEVTVIIGSDADSNEVKAVLFHYTCHPTLLNLPMASGDYPGAALRHIEEYFSGARAAFLPGCFGDVRPHATLVGGKNFRTGTPADVQEFGAALGEEVIRVVETSADAELLHPSLSARAEIVILPMQVEPEQMSLNLQRIDLAKELGFITMGGEMGVEFGHYIKALSREKVWIPVGYANGLIGYLCPAHQYEEGGFEPIDSCKNYCIPPFKPQCEELVKATIKQIINERELT